jgi:hypothetical protein
MLGRGADRFMLNQMQERVSAHPSNSQSRSMVVPDRERAGAPHVTMKVGQMPGPQRQVSSDWMPGMGEAPQLADVPTGALPGMGGLGDVTVSTGTLIGLAAVGAGLFYLMRKH